MVPFSYNEEKTRQIELRHIFFPSIYGVISEVIVAILALVAFNFHMLSAYMFGESFEKADPVELWGNSLENLLNGVQSYHFVQQVLLFVLWAIVGALIYVLIFRIVQLVVGIKESVGDGAQSVRRDHAWGIFYWLASLHDLFQKILIILLGGLAFAGGAIVCFGIASQELAYSLDSGFPENIWLLLVSLFAAILSIRFVALGISLLSARFRGWYTT